MLTQFLLKSKISDVGCYFVLMVVIMSHSYSCCMVLEVSKPIENHPVYYTMQNVFSNSLLVDKPICIRAGSLFLTIHLLDRRHYFVVESNQVSLA